nr:hypothetical protein [Mycoplasmopsis bovis]
MLVPCTLIDEVRFTDNLVDEVSSWNIDPGLVPALVVKLVSLTPC